MNRARRVHLYPDEWLVDTVELKADEVGVYITICAAFYSRGGPISRDVLRHFCPLTHGTALKRILRRLVGLGKIIEENGLLGMLPLDKRRGLLPVGYPAYPEDDIRSSRYISPSIKEAVWEASGGLCSYCGVSLNRGTSNRDPQQFTVDHSLAVAVGGAEDADNLVAACRSCNSSKGKLAVDLFTSKLGGMQ